MKRNLSILLLALFGLSSLAYAVNLGGFPQGPNFVTQAGFDAGTNNTLADANAYSDGTTNALKIALDAVISTGRMTMVFENSDSSPMELQKGQWNIWEYKDVSGKYTWIVDSLPDEFNTTQSSTLNFYSFIEKTGSATGDVMWVTRLRTPVDASFSDGAINRTYTNIVTMTTNTQFFIRKVSVTLDTPFTPGDLIEFEVERLGADVLDSFTGEIGVPRNGSLVYIKQ